MCDRDLWLKRVRRPRRHSQGGFSPIEVLVAAAVGLSALAAVLSFNRFQMLTLRNQTTQVDVQTTVRNIVELFAREVRRAGANPGCRIAGFNGLVDARSYYLRMQSDLNGDGVLTGVGEDVTYQYNWDADAVQRTDRGSGGTTETLASGVGWGDSIIRYFDGNGNEMNTWYWGSLSPAERSAVRRIRIQLNLTGKALGISGTRPLLAQASADVDLRNRYFLGNTACPGS